MSDGISLCNISHPATHAWLFDVDGVLCEPQQRIGSEVRRHLRKLQDNGHEVYLVTGNTHTKSVDLIYEPDNHWFPIFCNNADELRHGFGNLIWQDTETPPLPTDIGHELVYASYEEWTHPPNMIEWRSPRFVNYCPVGRYATKEKRDAHDTSWRVPYITSLKERYPEIEAVIGGQVSVDIYSKGADKSRAGKWLNDNGYTFTFIGDKTAPGGNDYPLAQYCEAHPENKCLTSTGPKHTLELIERELNDRLRT